MPMSHTFNNSKQFTVMNIVIALGRGTLTRVESNQMPMEIMELAYNARYCKFQGIGMQADWKIRIEMSENGGRSETTFEFIKCGLCLGEPVELLSFSKENHDGGYNV